MKRVLKWIGIVVGGLLGLILLLAGGVYAVSAGRLNKTYEVTADFTLTIPTDPELIAAGEKLYTIYCESCHGANLAGMAFSEDPAFGEIYSANLTAGRKWHRSQPQRRGDCQGDLVRRQTRRLAHSGDALRI